MSEPAKLERGLGLIEAVSLNMTFMVGIGPFVVVPFILRAMGGPQSLLAWVAGALLALLDGCVWAELGAAMPQAGGSYVFLREAYGANRWGRLMSFLFIWQTLFQAPLSISSGALGFARMSSTLFIMIPRVGSYLGSHWNKFVPIISTYERSIAVTVVLLALVLLYRKIAAIGKISIVLSVAALGTILWLIYGGVTHFDKGKLLAIPPGAWNFSWIFFAGLGQASVHAVYSYLGYYNVCNLGGEMKNPERNIPRAIFLSIIGIAILYFAMQASVLAVVPWQEARTSANAIGNFFMKAYGGREMTVAVALILITAFGSVFSATLGYSRVPYAAALDGNFFSIFARVHPTKHFPHISLLAIGAASVFVCIFFSLFSVIRAILAMRCLIQFVGQAVGLLMLHRQGKTQGWPFRMWFYPVPAVLAIAGWLGIFISTGRAPMLASLVAMLAGILVYLGRARWVHQWPFEETAG
jgi:fructoselysine transporter